MNFKKIKYFVIFLIITLFVYPYNLYAQDNGQKLLHSLQSKFNSLNDVSADFVQYTDGKKNLSGKLFYMKEDQIRIDLGNLVLITDGKSTWNYNKKQNKLIIDNYDPGSASILSIKNFIDVIPSKCSVMQMKNSPAIIELIPDSAGLSFSKAQIKINSEDLIENLSITNNSGQTIKILISDYKLNSGLSKSLFHLNPPKGSKVIDLR